jgi:hypothetical protein
MAMAITATMKYFAALFFAVLVAGCLNQPVEPASNCSDLGCPVDIPQATAEPQPTGPNCGDGILESPEQCDIGLPCKNSTFCQQCKCLQIDDGARVANCSAECGKYGYKDATVVADGNCSYNFGIDNPCAIRCAYRKIFPSQEAGNVCCCRDLKYVNCQSKTFADKCDCPTGDNVTRICAENKPEARISTGN